MKITALILGILGGLFGLGGAIIALFIGGLGGAFGAEGAGLVAGMGFLAIPVAILGIIGGALAHAKPKAAGIIMLISGILGFIAISLAYLIAGILLIVGGILALVASKSEKKTNHMTEAQ